MVWQNWCEEKYELNLATFRYLYLRNYCGNFFQIWYVRLCTVQWETFTKGKVDEFDELEWIRQSLTNQI